MTNEQIHQFSEDVLRIRRSFDRASDQLGRCENALRVASAKLEVLTQAIEKVRHEQHPPTS